MEDFSKSSHDKNNNTTTKQPTKMMSELLLLLFFYHGNETRFCNRKHRFCEGSILLISPTTCVNTPWFICRNYHRHWKIGKWAQTKSDSRQLLPHWIGLTQNDAQHKIRCLLFKKLLWTVWLQILRFTSIENNNDTLKYYFCSEATTQFKTNST